jgi:hypothetical protein
MQEIKCLGQDSSSLTSLAVRTVLTGAEYTRFPRQVPYFHAYCQWHSHNPPLFQLTMVYDREFDGDDDTTSNSSLCSSETPPTSPPMPQQILPYEKAPFNDLTVRTKTLSPSLN